MNKKFESQFKRIVGGTEEEKLEAKKELQEIFESEEKNGRFSSYELLTTERDEKIIQNTESNVDKIVKFYGGNAYPLPRKNIYVFKYGAVKILSKGKFEEGYHHVLGQRIFVEKRSSNIGLAITFAHELFHLKSYKSAQIDKKGKPDVYRSGISVFSAKREVNYFEKLEEAIIANLTHQFYQREIKNNPLYQTEVENTEKIKEKMKELMKKIGFKEEEQRMILDEIYSIPYSNPESVIKILEGDKVKNFLEKDKSSTTRLGSIHGVIDGIIEKEGGKVMFFERYLEKQKFDKLLEKILAKSGDRFKNKQELFDQFAKAHFSGNLLPLARIIETSLGKGAFRKIAEEFSKGPKIKKQGDEISR